MLTSIFKPADVSTIICYRLKTIPEVSIYMYVDRLLTSATLIVGLSSLKMYSLETESHG